MEEHCAWFEATYGEDTLFEPILVIPTERLEKDAYFSHDTKVLKKEGLVNLKKQIRDFFKEFKKFDFSGLDADLINQKLVAHNLHNDQFLQKFVVSPQK